MVSWSDLLVPSLVSAVLVFIASSLIHMVVRWHRSEYKTLPNEDAVRAAINKSKPVPGKYVMPFCEDGKEMATPEMQRKYVEGPNVVMYVRENGAVQLGPFLGKWFAYSLVVSLVVAYLARATIAPGADYLHVFQVVGVATWLAYAWAAPSDSIWMGKRWSSTFVYMLDGLIYAAATAGAFAWLWPDGAAS
ncbi:MAG: hypothetical protein IPJ77_08970 [Planctomycetes bacterium]|nr:hypothetical protein [Planctomycetota bacterium]